MFDVDLSWRMKLISSLLDYILKEIADVCVFALGYVKKNSKDVIKGLLSYRILGINFVVV